MDPITRAVLDTPFHQFCGLELVSQEAGAAVCRIPVNDATGNLNGVLHGGVLSAFMDVVAFLGLVPQFKSGEMAVTHDVHISMLRPAPKGAIVELRSKVLKRGKSVAFVHVDAYALTGGEEQHIAAGTITKSFVRLG